MCEPTTIFMAASLASAAVGAYSSIQQGNAAYQAGMYNAEIQTRNAQSVENDKANVQDAAAIERRRLGERVRAARGEQVAKFSAMGVDPGFGTPADLVGDIEQAYDADRAIMGRNELTELGRLDKQQADYLDAARMSRSEAKGARKAGQIGAVGSILQGVANVSSRWIQPNTATPAAGPSVRALKPITSIFQPLDPMTPMRLPAVGG
jgi:hypothetical protein